MELVIAIAGLVFWIAVALILVAYAVRAAGAVVERLWTRHDDKVREEALQGAGYRLHDYAWWFSEDTPTMNLLKRIAGDYTRGVHPDIGALRDQWRKDRQAAA